MHALFFRLAALMLIPLAVCAQVTVDVSLPNEQVLRNESLTVKVRVVNLSGQTVRIGEGSNWLTFQIMGERAFPIRQTAPVPLVGPFYLGSSKAANLTTDLMPYFDLGEVGSYQVTATLTVPQLQQTFNSAPKRFQVVQGTTLWEREFGVPSDGLPEVRKYALQQANFLKQLRLYLRISDPKGQSVFAVVSLGQLLSFSRPEAQLDKSSNLHVLFQSSGRGFTYEVVTPDGQMIIRQTHDYADSRPTLKMGEDGTIYVHGGKRRILSSDLPPPSEEEVVPDELPPWPGTNAPATNVTGKTTSAGQTNSTKQAANTKPRPKSR